MSFDLYDASKFVWHGGRLRWARASRMCRCGRSLVPLRFRPLFISGDCVVKEGADEFCLVGVALLGGELCKGTVLLGTDVGTCQLGSGLSLIRHICGHIMDDWNQRKAADIGGH